MTLRLGPGRAASTRLDRTTELPYAHYRGCREATVVDGDHALTFTWNSTSGPDLCSLLLWRNLRGWPAPTPYRSIGIEPLVGRVADLAQGERLTAPAPTRTAASAGHHHKLRTASWTALDSEYLRDAGCLDRRGSGGLTRYESTRLPGARSAVIGSACRCAIFHVPASRRKTRWRAGCSRRCRRGR